MRTPAIDRLAAHGLRFRSFYTMPVFAYGTAYIGLLWLFHNSSSRPVGSFNQFFGTMDAQLAYSYDAVRFVRRPGVAGGTREAPRAGGGGAVVLAVGSFTVRQP